MRRVAGAEAGAEGMDADVEPAAFEIETDGGRRFAARVFPGRPRDNCVPGSPTGALPWRLGDRRTRSTSGSRSAAKTVFESSVVFARLEFVEQRIVGMPRYSRRTAASCFFQIECFFQPWGESGEIGFFPRRRPRRAGRARPSWSIPPRANPGASAHGHMRSRVSRMLMAASESGCWSADRRVRRPREVRRSLAM